MQDARAGQRVFLGLRVALVAAFIGPGAGFDAWTARADEDPPPHRVAPRSRGSVRWADPQADAGATSGWWLGTTGIVLALAVCGALSLAARRGWRWPQGQAGGMFRVIGRTSLSPRHAVHLLRVGDRVLIVGTGPQSAPSLLGELTDLDELQPLNHFGPFREGEIPSEPTEVQARTERRPPKIAQPRSVVVNWDRTGGDAR
jgi:flagellar biogenesis protein FliO